MPRSKGFASYHNRRKKRRQHEPDDEHERELDHQGEYHDQTQHGHEEENQQQASDHEQQEQQDRVDRQNSRFIGRVYAPNVDPFSVGKMEKECGFCGPLQFPNEKSNCCHKGKVVLPPLAPYPVVQ